MENENLESESNKNQEMGELKNKMAKIRKDLKFLDKIYEFTNTIKEKYPGYQNYWLYHILAGSSPFPENPPKNYDFSDDDSIEKFINDNYLKCNES